jgi:hypothetical protein
MCVGAVGVSCSERELPVLFRCDMRYKVAGKARLFTNEIKKKFESALIRTA